MSWLAAHAVLCVPSFTFPPSPYAATAVCCNRPTRVASCLGLVWCWCWCWCWWPGAGTPPGSPIISMGGRIPRWAPEKKQSSRCAGAVVLLPLSPEKVHENGKSWHEGLRNSEDGGVPLVCVVCLLWSCGHRPCGRRGVAAREVKNVSVRLEIASLDLSFLPLALASVAVVAGSCSKKATVRRGRDGRWTTAAAATAPTPCAARRDHSRRATSGSRPRPNRRTFALQKF